MYDTSTRGKNSTRCQVVMRRASAKREHFFLWFSQGGTKKEKNALSQRIVREHTGGLFLVSLLRHSALPCACVIQPIFGYHTRAQGTRHHNASPGGLYARTRAIETFSCWCGCISSRVGWSSYCRRTGAVGAATCCIGTHG